MEYSGDYGASPAARSEKNKMLSRQQFATPKTLRIPLDLIERNTISSSPNLQRRQVREDGSAQH